MNILGIDYGTTRVGVAFSQGDLAQPIGTYTVPTEKQKLELVKRLCKQYEIDTIVIGKTSGTLAVKIDRFNKLIRQFFSGDVHFVEEAISTREAVQKLIAAGSSKKKRAKNLDAYAAVLILQRYIDDQSI